MAKVVTRQSGRFIEVDYDLPIVVNLGHGTITIIGTHATYVSNPVNSLAGKSTFFPTDTGLVAGVPLFSSIDNYQSDCVVSNAGGIVGTHLTSFDTITTQTAVVNVIKGQQFASTGLLGVLVLIVGQTNGVTFVQGDDGTPITIRLSGEVNPTYLDSLP